MKSTIAFRSNLALIDENYEKWALDPKSVAPHWQAFFEGFELGMSELKKRQAGSENRGEERITQSDPSFRARLVSMVYNYRALGHTQAHTDPLSKEAVRNPRLALSEFGYEESDLEREVATQFFANGAPMKLGEMVRRLEETYCERIGFEFMHIYQTEVRNWIREKIEERKELPPVSDENKRHFFRWLAEAEQFENFLHKKYVAQKRFGLEGGESTMVALKTILHACPGAGVREIIMGMAHRGRLNVLTNFLKKPISMIFHEFSENFLPNLACGDGDVKYHLGYKTVHDLGNDQIHVLLAPNPSHLEAVNSVVEGMVRARQRLTDDMEDRTTVLPVLIHGDASFAGQGSVAEVLNYSQVPGYRTGGTVHIVINNQIGFTTSPVDARSSVYCTDVAKMIEAPIFHVNGDSPEDVAFAARLAFEFRQKFHRDVVVDVICYRKHGHNEADEPAFTQPKIYKHISGKRSPREIYQSKLVESGTISQEDAEEMLETIQANYEKEYEMVKKLEGMGESSFHGSAFEAQPSWTFENGETAVDGDRLKELGSKLVAIPEGFRVNDKLHRFVLEKRKEAAENGGPYDWAHAESLAFASLVTEGHSVRLSGQDVRRGTFSQRHAVLYDSETRERWMPLEHLSGDQAKFRAYNSILSEAGVLGFDYGYSLMIPEMLICWEAQFGDFANGAQVIIDQFISSAESKWLTPSNITMLLPHGYEGQGPEHSSARMERFLQLCAANNIQVCNLTTPAQYFHALRRQVKRPFRKPLVIFTPKSLLRHDQCVSYEADLTGESQFVEILDDTNLIETPARVTRLIFCTGKVYYDLLNYRNEHKLRNVAIIRIEQLYPFHSELFESILKRYPRANKKWVWCQEEPRNMGAWNFIRDHLEAYTRFSQVRYAGRSASASTATGSKAIHTGEQKNLVASAFEV